MTVQKRTMDRYDVRSNGEYATICIREWKNETYYGGEILIHSSFGSWANSWNACANNFRRFLISCDFDYIFGKFLGHALHVFDGEESTKAVRKKLIALRRTRDIDADTTREVWEALDSADEHSIESWVRSMQETGHDYRENRHLRDLFDEPWYQSVEKHDVSAVGFWRELWPEFREALRAECTAPSETSSHE